MADQFDLFESKQAKADAMSRVDEHADPDWKEAALRAVHAAAMQQPLFTVDDVVALIDPGAHTHELRALGPVMMRGAKAGWIIKAPLPAINCRRANCHSAPLTVWKSLVFEGST